MTAVSYYLEQTRKEDRKNGSNTGIEEKHLLPFITVVMLSIGVSSWLQKIASTSTDFLNQSFIGFYKSQQIVPEVWTGQYRKQQNWGFGFNRLTKNTSFSFWIAESRIFKKVLL